MKNACCVVVIGWMLLAGVAQAGTYYVSAQGRDTGTGRADAPLATIGRALALAAGETETTIVLGPGTIVTGEEPLTLRSGVTLRGAGRDRTTLIATVRLRNTSDIAITDLTLAGAADDKAERRRLAVDALDGCELRLERLAITRFTHGAIKLERWQKALVEDCVIERATFNTFKQDGKTPAEHTTAILLGDIADVAIRYTNIDTTERGGRGIGSCKETWSKTPWADPPTKMVRLEIAHCDIKVDQWHAWHVPGTTNHPPQMTIELWHAYTEEVVIHHCRLNNNVSLTCDADGKKPVPAKTIRMHQNRFELIPTSQSYRYAVESYVNNFEFERNIVINGVYPLADFNKNGVSRDVRVHRNVFYGTDTGALINSASQMPGLQFTHNTMVLTTKQKGKMAAFGQGEEKNMGQRVANNLFLSEVEQDKEVGFMVGVERNGFWNLPTAGKDAVTGDFKLVGKEQMPWPYFSLQAGSAAIDKGVVIAALNEQHVGKAPDLGAYEFGGEAWFAGPNRPPEVKLLVPATAVVGQPLRVMARVVDDGAPQGGKLTVMWSAPAEAGANFGAATAAEGMMQFRNAGRWTITCTVSDGEMTTRASAEVAVSRSREGVQK